MTTTQKNLSRLAAEREREANDQNLLTWEREERKRQAAGYRAALLRDMESHPEPYPFATVATEPIWTDLLRKLAAMPDWLRYRIFAGVCLLVPVAVLLFIWAITR